MTQMGDIIYFKSEYDVDKYCVGKVYKKEIDEDDDIKVFCNWSRYLRELPNTKEESMQLINTHNENGFMYEKNIFVLFKHNINRRIIKEA